MNINQEGILKKHCYTELVYERINKKLDSNFSKEESEALIKKVLEETHIDCFEKKGKNFYITNYDYKIKITVNSNTFRIITVDRITTIIN